MKNSDRTMRLTAKEKAYILYVEKGWGVGKYSASLTSIRYAWQDNEEDQ
jgi:hypothetical protein